MNIIIINFVLLFLSINLYAQNFIVFKGTIKDKITNLPIAFVNIYTDNYKTMVVSNNQGAFRILVENNYTGSLTFEHISYKKYVVTNIANISQEFEVNLENNLHQLKDITLNTQTEEWYIKKTINNLDKNYSTKAKTFEAFHRGDYTVSDWAKNVLCSQMKVEQILHLHIQYPEQNETKRKNNKKGRGLIKCDRIKARFIDNTHPIEINIMSSLARLTLGLDIAYFQKIVVLDENNIKRYSFSIDTTENISEDYIKFKFKPKKNGKLEKETVNGEIIINKNDFAMTHITLIERKRQRIKEANEVHYVYENRSTTINYSKIDGFYYPTYIRSSIYETNEYTENNQIIDGFFDKGTSEVFITKEIDNKLNVTNITNYSKEDGENEFRMFFDENQENDVVFWENYNTIYPEKESYKEEFKTHPNEVTSIFIKSMENLENVKNGKYTMIHVKKEKELTNSIDSLFIIFEKKIYGSYSSNMHMYSGKDKEIYLNSKGLFEIENINKTYKYYAPSSREYLFPDMRGLIFPAIPKSTVYFNNIIQALKVCKSNLKKEKINDEDVYAIEIQYPDSKDMGVRDFKEYIYIRIKDYMPIKIVIRKQKYGKLLSEEWIIKDIILNNIDLKTLELPIDIKTNYKRTN